MNDKICLSPQQLQLVKTILRKYIHADTFVWVFGSRANGNPKKYSDLDLAIDNQGKKLPPNLLIDLSLEFEESDLPYKVDMIDWNDITEAFRKHIEKDKILLNLDEGFVNGK